MNKKRFLKFKRNRFGKQVAYVPLYETEFNGNSGLCSNIYTIGGKNVVISLKETQLESKRGNNIPYMVKFTIFATSRYYTI